MKKFTFGFMFTIALMLTTLFVVGCSGGSSNIKSNREIVKLYEEGWNNKDKLNIFDDIIATNFINHSPLLEHPQPGPEGLKPIVKAIFAGFPDLHYKIIDVVYGEDKVAIRSVLTGTQTGNFFGIPPTGKKIKVNQ